MKPLNRQSGFTLIELLIATSVFTVVLLIVATAVLSFSRQYYRGVITSATQNVTRSLVDEIGRTIAYNDGTVSALHVSGAPISAPADGYCIGSAKRYSFARGQQVTAGSLQSDQSYHGLVSDTVSNCTTGTPALSVKTQPAVLPPAPALVGARELLGDHMRLAKFVITPDAADPTLYTVSVRVVYGDRDLLCSPSVAGDCASDTPTSVANLSADDLSCKPQAGSQFCAVSELTTTVKQRVGL